MRTLVAKLPPTVGVTPPVYGVDMENVHMFVLVACRDQEALNPDRAQTQTQSQTQSQTQAQTQSPAPVQALSGELVRLPEPGEGDHFVGLCTDAPAERARLRALPAVDRSTLVRILVEYHQRKDGDARRAGNPAKAGVPGGDPQELAEREAAQIEALAHWFEPATDLVVAGATVGLADPPASVPFIGGQPRAPLVGQTQAA